VMGLSTAVEAPAEQRHSGDVEHILQHDGKLYTAADDGKVKVWSLDLKLETEWQAHDYAVLHMLIDQGKLLTAGMDNAIKVWDLASLKCLQTLTPHDDSVRRLARAGDKIYSGDDKGAVYRWSFNQGGELVAEGKYDVVEEVWDLWAKDIFFVSVRDRGVSITETTREGTTKNSVVKVLQGRAPLYVSDNYLVHTQHSNGFGFMVYKFEPVQFPHLKDLKGHDAIVTCLTGSVLQSGKECLASGGYDNKIKVWALPGGELEAETPCTTTPTAVCLTPCGGVYVGGSDGFLCRYTIV